jgi:hypothetical protein
MHFAPVSPVFKGYLAEISTHRDARRDIVKEMGKILPGAPVRNEGSAAEKGENNLQSPVNI